MWVFGKDGFMSITALPGRDDYLFVQTKSKEHLEDWFPEATHHSKMYTSYPHRAVVSREDVALALIEYVMNIIYDDFRGAIEEIPYNQACNEIYFNGINLYSRYRQQISSRGGI